MKSFSSSKLLEPFGIKNTVRMALGAYERHLPEAEHEIGKRKLRESNGNI